MNVPWLPYLATEFLEAHIRPDWKCFEWGSGSSTLWLAERCARVVSVEHDLAWELTNPPPNVEQSFIPPECGEIGIDPSDPDHYRSASTEVGPGWNWKQYATAIDAHGMFDLVLVDGMARVSCVKHAVPHVKPGGWLVLDNTGDRPHYLKRNGALFGDWQAGSWERVTFLGHGPLLKYLWETTMFRRPE